MAAILIKGEIKLRPSELKTRILNGEMDSSLELLYGHEEERIAAAREKCARVLSRYTERFGEEKTVRLFSAPGRAEICGNHTDHNYGIVAAAAVDLDAVAAASKNGTNIIRLMSEGYGSVTIDLSDLSMKKSERGTTTALLRGIAAAFIERGHGISGFDAFVISDVPKGSGLSSSACFEVLICSIISGLFCSGMISPVEMAFIGREAENDYFGKPSGLMDQLACAMGGFLKIDFENPASPDLYSIDTSLDSMGLSMVVVDSGTGHEDLSDLYAQIPNDMYAAAAHYGAKYLREIDEDMFINALPSLKKALGNRVTMRALHFFNENKRVERLVAALRDDDRDEFLRIISESGKSSFAFLRNVNSELGDESMSLAAALGVSELLCGDCGAFRVHGGGFGGTMIAFVDNSKLDFYLDEMQQAFGNGCCKVLRVRPLGGCELITNGEE